MRNITPIEPACWRALACSEARASYCASAASYRLSKDVFVVPIVESELELREVQQQIFFAHVMISADNSALQSDQKFSMLFVCTSPRTYSLAR
jgi:hypothetical protein